MAIAWAGYLESLEYARNRPQGRPVTSKDPATPPVRIVEHADATPAQRAISETNAGFYAIKLGHLRADLASLRADNAKGELYLTDLGGGRHTRLTRTEGAAEASPAWS